MLARPQVKAKDKAQVYASETIRYDIYLMPKVLQVPYDDPGYQAPQVTSRSL